MLKIKRGSTSVTPKIALDIEGQDVTFEFKELSKLDILNFSLSQDQSISDRINQIIGSVERITGAEFEDGTPVGKEDVWEFSYSDLIKIVKEYNSVITGYIGENYSEDSEKNAIADSLN